MERSRSYPESIHDISQMNVKRELTETKQELQSAEEALNQFKEKDQARINRLVSMDSNSSIEMTMTNQSPTCKSTLLKLINYLLDRGEQSRRLNNQIKFKSYAGFYYFVKWLIRSIFLLFFTTLGNIAGKEIGCAISDHRICDLPVVSLAGNSPHIIGTILGTIIGLITGQFIGLRLWNCGVQVILGTLRRIEKMADSSKAFLYTLCVLLYTINIALFSIMFHFFVPITFSALIGGFTAAIIGLIIAIGAYQKISRCYQGQQTPQVRSINIVIENPPQLEL